MCIHVVWKDGNDEGYTLRADHGHERKWEVTGQERERPRVAQLGSIQTWRWEKKLKRKKPWITYSPKALKREKEMKMSKV